jgi:hypothetical protein
LEPPRQPVSSSVTTRPRRPNAGSSFFQQWAKRTKWALRAIGVNPGLGWNGSKSASAVEAQVAPALPTRLRRSRPSPMN